MLLLAQAAELLKMDVDIEEEDDDGSNEESLCQITESYFCMLVTLNKDLVCNVFHSCLSLLPEAEHTAFLASRCLEALFSLDGSDDDEEDEDEDENGLASCADGLKTVSPENFRVIADSLQRRLTGSHDLLYRVVDLYFLVCTGKITEEQRSQICSCIDCGILSSSLLLHAVQNPRMPLRFIVQAMLIEQLNSHRSIFSALNTATATTITAPRPQPQPRVKASSPATLGAILERDAALRQVAKLRATIDTTSSRIQTLERELTGMKQLLLETEKHKQNHKNNSLLVLDQPAGRSSSCRFSSNVSNKVERGERGSVSSSMLRFRDPKLENDQTVISPRIVKRNFGQRLIRGLKNAFGASSKAKDHRIGKAEQMGVNNGDENDGVSKILQVVHSDSANPHHRSHSVS